MRRRRAYNSNGNKEEGQQQQQQERNNKKQKNWMTADDLHNELFEKFYRGNIVPEADWEAFMAALRRDLPTSMRISFCSFANDTKLQQFLTGLAADLNSAISTTAVEKNAVDDDAAAATKSGGVRQVSFIPNAIDAPEMSRGDLKRSPGNRSAKTAIQCLSESGLLSRQEIVSMVPPLMLDVQPGNTVLDLCAAPGSKTLQCLERLVRGPAGTAATTTAQGGCVVANDVNAGRLDVLQRQAGRSPFAASRLIVTNHDARFFPSSGGAVRFDRVLCDAMCSGDGTLRKSLDLWERWRPTSGPALHTQQRAVLYKGMQLCKAGGIVVYSTCSMHPAEDEAVVAACIKDAGGSEHFELIDPRTQLPNLRFYAGLRDWKVMRSDGSWCTSAADVTAAAVPAAAADNSASSSSVTGDEKRKGDGKKSASAAAADKKFIVPSMFPDFAANDTPNIEYCCRVVPQLQDTGGFFIAAMRCKKEIRTRREGKTERRQQQQQDAPQGDNDDDVDGNNDDVEKNDQNEGAAVAAAAAAVSASKQHQNNAVIKPVIPASEKPDGHCPISAEVKADLQRCLRLPDDFPFHCLFSRRQLSREPKMYFVAGAAPSVMQRMDAKVVGLGVRVIESTVKNSFSTCRFSVEGAAVLAPFLPQHCIDVELEPVFEAVKAFIVAQQEQQKKQQQQQSNTVKQFETIKVPITTKARAHLPVGVHNVLVRVKLGPHLMQLADKMNVLVLPGEVDYTGASGTVSVKMSANHMALLAYSQPTGMEAVRQWNALNSSSIKAENDDDNEDEDDKDAVDNEQPVPANDANKQ